jgi:hypothetical protein
LQLAAQSSAPFKEKAESRACFNRTLAESSPTRPSAPEDFSTNPAGLLLHSCPTKEDSRETNFRTGRAFLSAAKKCALTISLIALFASVTAAQTNTFPSSGNVGIGTTSPGVAIDVVNSVAAGTGTARFKNTNANTQVIIDTAASQNANLRFDKNASPFWYLGNEASNDRFRFLNSNSNGNVEVFTILQGGNVGIGTTNPAATLDIVTGTGTNNSVHQLRLKTANPNYTTFGRLGVNYDTLYITQNAFYNGTAWIADDPNKRSAQIRLGQYANSIDFHTSSTVNTPDPPFEAEDRSKWQRRHRHNPWRAL